jgi:hypothetical protein
LWALGRAWRTRIRRNASLPKEAAHRANPHRLKSRFTRRQEVVDGSPTPPPVAVVVYHNNAAFNYFVPERFEAELDRLVPIPVDVQETDGLDVSRRNRKRLRKPSRNDVNSRPRDV